MDIFYDNESSRLVFLDTNADSDYWDNRWNETYDDDTIFRKPPKHRQLKAQTLKYLPPGSKIIEGGCGIGDKVLALEEAGFNAVGVDYAQRTVDRVKSHWPNLTIELGDVRKLNFADNEFDGYWSIGVIEHFYDGYHEILAEMARTIKLGGYLFITFPFLSQSRLKRSIRGKIPEYQESETTKKQFYQFGLNINTTIKDLDTHGFDLVETKYRGSLLYLNDPELSGRFIPQLLNKLPSKLYTIIAIMIDRLLGYKYGHSCVLVLKRR